MMEAVEDEDDELPLNELVTRDLDHNDNHDNAHIVTRMEPFRMRKPSEELSTTSTKCVGVHSSPHRCSSRSSSDNPQQVPGLLYSPEDTLNNDFFYDDEFAVQFDAHLGGNEEEIMDSMEFHTLLQMTGDDNQRWQNLTRMTSSKSDSCLYQPELDVSGTTDPIGSSSERELLSSSDLSDFKAEPLFSPPPPHGDMEDSCSAFNSDSLCNEELAGSLVKDEDRYAFDWTTTKDQYMISFDRSPTKYSSEDSYQEPTKKKPCKQLTSWGQRSNGNTSSSSAVCSTGSSSSRRSSSHLSSTSGTSGSGVVGSSTSLPTSPLSQVTANGNDSVRQSSTDTSTSSTMTTWKLVKQQHKKGSSVPEGMTTWKMVKESVMTGSGTVRSQSMPNLQPPEVDKVVMREPKHDDEDTKPKRHSTSLLEMYRKMKLQSGLVLPYQECPEQDIEPMIQFEMDTWSVSPASSYQYSPTSECPSKGDADNGLVKWNTVKNLVNSPPSPSKQSTSINSNSVDMATQAGSILSESRKRLKPRGDISVQYPPLLNDCGVQTSFDNGAKGHGKTHLNKALQTSWELLASAQWRLRNGFVRRRVRPHSVGSIPSRRYPTNDPFTVQLSKQAKQRMSHSMFFNSTVLPDLSFLNKDMSCSLANITQNIQEKAKKSSGSQHNKPVSKIPDLIPTSEPGYRPKKPPRQQRPRSACLAHSRESSPLLMGAKMRSRSSDSASSFCSSSSSGIDPGSYDSLTNRTSGQYMSSHHSRRDDLKRPHPPADTKVIVAKEAKKMTKPPGFWHVDGREKCSPKMCNICQAQSRSSPGERDHESMAASHPVYRKVMDEDNEDSSWGTCDCHGQCGCAKVSLEICQPSPCRCSTVCTGCSCYTQTFPDAVTECGQCTPICSPSKTSPTMGHILVNYPCHINSKPLKSCLVKRRKVDRKLLAFKHRSWSDPSDGLVLKYSQEGQIKYQLVTQDIDCTRRQPLSEIELLDDFRPAECHRNKDPAPAERLSPKQQTSPTAPGDVKPLTSPIKNIDGVVLRRKKKPMVTPPNSPEQIPIPACTCGTTHAVLHSSSDSGDGACSQTCYDIFRSKKSVSFSEQISYHSPHHSPHQSPRRQVRPLVGKDTGTGVVVRHPLGKHLSPKKRPVSLPPDFRLIITQPASQPIPENLGGEDCESPPKDFVVSPPSSVTLTPSPTEPPSFDLASKKELIQDIMKATEKLLHYFGQTRDQEFKVELGSTSQCTDIGHLVLEHFCPAVYAVVLDGLKPHVRSLFGKVKNSVWRVVEDSADAGPSSRVIHDLVQDLKTLDFLTSTWLKFNAFVFGLLNHKALDLWLSQLQSNERLLSKHYDSESFLRLTSTTAKPLYLDLVTVIQPLSQMPFRLEYNFEFRQLEGKQHQQLSDIILDKHVSRSGEGQVESRHWRLYQQQTQRLQELSRSDSPVRGEISPVQGKQGKAEGVLHHSAPEVYQPQQVVVWSPTKVRWHSLYDKVHEQLSKSELAKNTRLIVSDTSKQLLRSLKESRKLKLSKEALQHLGQDLVQVAVGYSNPVRVIPKIPGLTDSSDTLIGQSSSHDSTPTDTRGPGKSRKALMVFDNHEMVISAQTSSSEEEKDSESLLKKMSQKLFSSPQKVYKQGITEYQFHVCRDKSSAKVPDSKIVAYKARVGQLAKAKSVDTATDEKSTETGPSWSQRKSLFDANGLPRSSSMDQAPVEFQIPSRSESMESPGSSNGDKTLSEGSHSSSSDDSNKTTKSLSPEAPRPAAAISHKLGSSLRKSWSSFGPSLVNWMDRLLLEDPATKNKTKSEENIHTTPEDTSPEMPCQSGARKPLQRAATVATCDDKDIVVPHTNTDYIKSVLESGNFGVMGPESANTAAVKTKATTPPVREEVNWFVQALCHHVAMQEDQLSFTKGTVMAVIRQVDADWLLCRHGDKEGLVHNACVSKA